MIVSESRIEANRRNAAKSTGPKTSDGKAISRANALKHGLCATTVIIEEVEQIKARASDWYYALKPQNSFQIWLVDEIAVISLRIDHQERSERKVRDKVAFRAELCWDDDRRLETEILGAMLPKRPSETVEALRRTPHGCEWLMTRWAMLARVADVDHVWTDEQASLAFDMMATPSPFRPGRKPGESIDFDGRVLESGADLAAVARREIAGLRERREVAAEIDEIERTLAEHDLNQQMDPELRRLRRYEGTLHRRLQWCLTQLNDPSPQKRPYPGVRPNWSAPPEPAVTPEPKTEDEIAAENHPANAKQPPFCLEPHEFPEPDQYADIPSILTARKAARLAKAESRRDAKRRKLEKLRA